MKNLFKLLAITYIACATLAIAENCKAERSFTASWKTNFCRTDCTPFVPAEIKNYTVRYRGPLPLQTGHDTVFTTTNGTVIIKTPGTYLMDVRVTLKDGTKSAYSTPAVTVVVAQ